MQPGSRNRATATFLASRQKTWALSVLAGATALALAGGLISPTMVKAVGAAISPVSIAPPNAPSSFADLVEQVQDAVVAVAVTSKSDPMPHMNSPELDLPENAPFREFFRRYFDQPGPQGRSGGDSRGMGSGFIVDAEGHIVTNHHVIKDASEITVILKDGTRLPATVKGHDARTDLAVLKVEHDQPLPQVTFGDANSARVGDWVVAVGSPYGLGGTVTAGIISARGRDIQSGQYDDYLQIDAPINRGNSGGPLFDGSGRVIGVNTAIYSPSGGSVGIGFAIPSSLAQPVVAQLTANGSVERGWLGVQIQAVTETVAQSLGLEEHQGALVASVVPDSPAYRAGLRPGDIILRMDGEPLQDHKALSLKVADTKTGTESVFEIRRPGGIENLKVEIGRMPGSDQLATNTPEPQADDTPRIGVQLAELTAEARKRYGIDDQSTGVLVVDVLQDSPAEKSGIQPGSLITMVGQEPVAHPGEVVEKVREAAKSERPSVLLLVEHEGRIQFVAVEFATA